MSSEDVVMARGQLVTDYAESKEKVALLRNNIYRTVAAFNGVAEAIGVMLSEISEIASVHTKYIPPEERLKASLREIPVHEILLKQCADLKTETARYEELAVRIKSLNL